MALVAAQHSSAAQHLQATRVFRSPLVASAAALQDGKCRIESGDDASHGDPPPRPSHMDKYNQRRAIPARFTDPLMDYYGERKSSIRPCRIPKDNVPLGQGGGTNILYEVVGSC